MNNKSHGAGFGTRGWILIIVGWLCFYMSASAVNDSLNVTLPMFFEKFGWENGQLSRIATYSGWFGAIMLFPAGALMKKVGPKVMLILAEIDFIFCVLMLGVVNNIYVYAVLFALICLGADVIGIQAFGCLASHWFPKKKGNIMGWATVGCNLGSCTVVWLLSGSWKLFGNNLMGFVPYACIPLLGLIFTILFLKDYPEQCGCYPDNDQNMTPEMAREIYEEGLRYKEKSPWTVKKLLTTKQTWLIIIGLGMFQLCTMGVVSHIVPILSEAGYSQTQAMMGMTAAGIIAIPCSILLGIYDSKNGTRKAALLLGIISLIAFIFAAFPFKWATIIAVLEGGVMMGCSNNLLASMVSSVYGRFDYDSAIGVIQPLYMILGSSGAGVVGTISDMGGNRAVMISMAVLCVVALVLLILLSDRCIGHVLKTDKND